MENNKKMPYAWYLTILQRANLSLLIRVDHLKILFHPDLVKQC